MSKSAEARWWLAHLWVIALSVTVVAVAAVMQASSIVALSATISCAVIIRTSLSSLVRAYIAYIVLGLVIAPLFAKIQNLNLDRIQLLASLWILAVCVGGVVSARTSRTATRFRAVVRGQRITPVAVIAILSLFVEYALVAQGSFGIAGQYAIGDSGGGYLGLLVQIGPPSAAGALLATLGRPKRTTGDLIIPTLLVILQAVALTFSGFRGAAPLYVLAVALCSFRPAVSKLKARRGRRAVVASILICFVGGLFLLGASVRHSVAAAAGSAAPDSSFSNTLPIVVQRFDESRSLIRADESRDLFAVREAVSLSNQLAAIVPRFLYPSKGNIDYGKQVAIAAYGEPANTKDSPTLTTFGDAIINMGLAGGFVLVAMYALLVDTVFRRTRRAATVRSLSVRVVLVTAALNLEAPIVLNLIGILRVTIAILVVQWLFERAFSPLGDRRRKVGDRPWSAGGEQPLSPGTTQMHAFAQPHTAGRAGRASEGRT